jgi:beta-galactosidase
LEAHVTVQNDTEQPVCVELKGEVFRFTNRPAFTLEDSPFLCPELDPQPVLRGEAARTTVPPKGTVAVILRQRVERRLETWEPHRPTLYTLVIGLKSGQLGVDAKSTRFGWRQFSIRGSELLLNGLPLTLRGDSWHFMGVPQMTRRYARAWFSMLQGMGLNAVRLHAQPTHRSIWR